MYTARTANGYKLKSARMSAHILQYSYVWIAVAQQAPKFSIFIATETLENDNFVGFVFGC